MCGNGARCVAKYYYDEIKQKSELKFANKFNIITHAIILNDNITIRMPMYTFINNDFITEFGKFISTYTIEKNTSGLLNIGNLFNQKTHQFELLGCMNVGVPHIIIKSEYIKNDQFIIITICMSGFKGFVIA